MENVKTILISHRGNIFRDYPHLIASEQLRVDDTMRLMTLPIVSLM